MRHAPALQYKQYVLVMLFFVDVVYKGVLILVVWGVPRIGVILILVQTQIWAFATPIMHVE